jgi:hypothetical protein
MLSFLAKIGLFATSLVVTEAVSLMETCWQAGSTGPLRLVVGEGILQIAERIHAVKYDPEPSETIMEELRRDPEY